MFDKLYADVNRTIKSATLLKVERKMERSDRNDPNSPMKPAQDKDGVPKYTVHLSVETSSFDKTKFDNIQVTVNSRDNLVEAFPTKCDVVVLGLAIGLMPQGKSTYSVFFTADAIRPLQPTQLTQPGQASRVVPGQPPQPARVS
jgi:hypothetical protein